MVFPSMCELEAATAGGTTLHLRLAIDYSSRWTITQAARAGIRCRILVSIASNLILTAPAFHPRRLGGHYGNNNSRNGSISKASIAPSPLMSALLMSQSGNWIA